MIFQQQIKKKTHKYNLHPTKTQRNIILLLFDGYICKIAQTKTQSNSYAFIKLRSRALLFQLDVKSSTKIAWDVGHEFAQICERRLQNLQSHADSPRDKHTRSEYLQN